MEESVGISSSIPTQKAKTWKSVPDLSRLERNDVRPLSLNFSSWAVLRYTWHSAIMAVETSLSPGTFANSDLFSDRNLPCNESRHLTLPKNFQVPDFSEYLSAFWAALHSSLNLLAMQQTSSSTFSFPRRLLQSNPPLPPRVTRRCMLWQATRWPSAAFLPNTVMQHRVLSEFQPVEYSCRSFRRDSTCAASPYFSWTCLRREE